MPFHLTQGDRRPLFVVSLTDDHGEPSQAFVDLTTATGAVFNMRAVGGAVKINAGSMAITNGTAGEVTYSWGTADVNTVGTFDANSRVTWNDGKASSFPNDGTFWSVVISPGIP